MSKKLVTVFGATGNQGGSVIATILDSPALHAKYALRGVTRDPTKAKAQALAARGVEMVRGDMADAASLAATVKDSYAVFGVTNYWELFSQEAEEKQGRAIADAAFAAGVQHLIWSSLPHVGKLSGGTLNEVFHFDGKANIGAYIDAHHPRGTAASYFMPAVFMEQLKGAINPDEHGQLTLAFHIDPNAPFPLINAAQDTGKWVAGILEAGPEADGRHVHAVGDWQTPEGIVQAINAVAGTNIVYKQIPRDVFKTFMPQGAEEEMAQNFDLIQDYQYFGKGAHAQQADHDRFLLKGAKVTTWKEFVAANGPWEK